MLTLCWPKLPLSCPYVDPMVTYVGLGNALPHSSDRNDGGGEGVGTGWERGHPGSPQAGAAAGAASLYNLRLPTEGLRQGHGLGTLPGARIQRLTPKGGYVGAMLASLGPISALCCPYVSRMLAHVGPMLA